MSRSNRLPVMLLVFAILSTTSFAKNLAPAGNWQTAAPVSDETALRVLSERFFAAYAKNDLEGCRRLWSEKSPDLATSTKEFQQTFAANIIVLKSLTIRKIKVENGKATVRVIADINVFDVQTGNPV